MKLFAIADLHLSNQINREALQAIQPRPQDALLIAGDVGEKLQHFKDAFDILCPRFGLVLWVPGNHDLWTTKTDDGKRLAGAEKYRALVDLCRSYGVLTPEDPYTHVTLDDGSGVTLVPLCLLYDYSHAPDGLDATAAIAWAAKAKIHCADEIYLSADPHSSVSDWCAERLSYTRTRLASVPKDAALVVINHYPLHRDHIVLPRIPRFRIWSGTRASETLFSEHTLRAVIFGHLHVRFSHVWGSTRYEEVSLGYPAQWQHHKGIEGYLRQILPTPTSKSSDPGWEFHP